MATLSPELVTQRSHYTGVAIARAGRNEEFAPAENFWLAKTEGTTVTLTKAVVTTENGDPVQTDIWDVIARLDGAADIDLTPEE